jgi:pyrophosphatase PpaX
MVAPTRAVFFDLDGTLLDSIRLIIDSYHHALATHGLPPKTDQHWLAGIGTPLRVQFREWANQPDLFESLIAVYRDYNIANHDSRVRAYPGAVEMVRQVRRAGIRTGLVTSKQRAGAERGLRFLALAGEMEVIVAADDVTNPKPHPEPLLIASSQLDTDPRAAIYVGDSVHDMECGRAAGMKTAAALWGPFDRAHLASSRPDYWLERPADLVRLLSPAA